MPLEAKYTSSAEGENTIWLRAFPNEHRLSVALGLRIGWNETNEPHTLGLSVVNADLDVMQEIAQAQFETGRPPGLKRGTEQIAGFAIDCAVELDEPGDLFMALNVDGETLKRIPFTVVPAATVTMPGQQ